LRSSLAGELVDKAVNPGQEVRADAQLANVQQIYTPLFVVGDPTRLWLQLDVSDADLSEMKTGLALHITCPSFPGKVFDGVIDNIGQTLDPSTRTIKVRGVVNNPDKLLKAEMYVLVDVIQDVTKVADSGVEVPAKAIYMKGNDSYLFIEQSPGQYVRKKVKTGVEMDNKVPVFEGLTAGQKVVTDGAVLLRAVVESSE
jgi:cobalt-zinc-cadmium efflux system membrane fusion protein